MKLGRNRLLISAALIVIVIAAVAVILVAQNNSAAPMGTVITPQDYQARFVSADHLLIDVRTPDEYASGHIAGAVNIPLDTLSSRLAEVPNNRDVVLYCRSGNRSNQARQLLNERGYTRVYDLGGVMAWQAAGYPLE
jgi:phage shock protein E